MTDVDASRDGEYHLCLLHPPLNSSDMSIGRRSRLLALSDEILNDIVRKTVQSLTCGKIVQLTKVLDGERYDGPLDTPGVFAGRFACVLVDSHLFWYSSPRARHHVSDASPTSALAVLLVCSKIYHIAVADLSGLRRSLHQMPNGFVHSSGGNSARLTWPIFGAYIWTFLLV